MSNNFFTIAGFIYSILLLFVYFSRQRIKSFETKTYDYLVIINVITNINAIICYLTIKFKENIPIINDIISKSLLICYLLWIMLFTIYMIGTSEDLKQKNFKKIISFLMILIIIFIISIIMLPLYYNNNKGIYSYGPAANVVYIFSGIMVVIWLVLIAKNISKMNNKKYIPLFMIILLGSFVIIIQKDNPSLLLLSFLITFITFLMYHTIENPDMKMLNELEKSNEMLETEMDEKSNLMFKISQDIRVPLSKIEELSSKMINEKSIQTLVNDSKKINSETKGVSFIINNLLDISNMNINNIKLYKTKVNINNLLKEISLIINNKNFKYNTSNTIPDIFLDNVRIKQILISLINYSFNNKSTYCYLEVSGIIRYDMCRLLITINTDNKLDIKNINEIMNSKDMENINTDSVDFDLISIKSIVNMLNGSFNIKSSENTTYSIVVDTELVNKETKYNVKNKKVLLIDDDKDELNKYRDILKSLDISVNTSMFLSDIENRIDNINDYDIILVDDEMQPYNAVKIMEYKEKYNITTKIVIMLGINKEFIKEKYINDCKFDDYILKREYKKEIKRIIDNYL